MKNEFSSRQWIQEYQDFLCAEEVNPPEAIQRTIESRIHTDLNPKPFEVFMKLAVIHTIVGTLNLLVCPYSEINIMSGWSPMHFLMQWGEGICMFACGALYLAGSVLVASFVLRPEDIRLIRKTGLLQVTILSLVSMSILICTGVLFLSSFFWFWLLGSIAGGVITLEVSWVLKNWVLKRRHLYI